MKRKCIFGPSERKWYNEIIGKIVCKCNEILERER